MPLPAGVEKVLVTAGEPLTLPDGTAVRGRFLFSGPDLVTIAGQDVTLGGTAEAVLVNGDFSKLLVAPDATGMSPSGWTYRVEADFDNAPGWVRYISLSKASPTVKLADVLVPDPVTGTYTTLVDPAAVLGGVAVTGPASAGLVLTADSSAAASWQAPSGGGGGGGGTPSNAVTAETAYGQSSSAGAATTYARGDHTHGTPPGPTAGTTAGTFAAGNDSRLSNSRTPTGAAGGDLSGTYPNPAVAKVGGVAVTGTPSSGQVLTASSPTAASWQTPSAGGGGGTTIRTADARVTAGDVVLGAAGSWTIVTSGGTPLAASITAAVGDRIQACPSFMRAGGGAFLDLVILASGAISRYMGTDSSTPLLEGHPSYYPQAASFPGVPGAMQIVVGAGEVDGSGKATIALAYQGTGGETIYASATYPFYLLLTNLGPEPA